MTERTSFVKRCRTLLLDKVFQNREKGCCQISYLTITFLSILQVLKLHLKYNSYICCSSRARGTVFRVRGPVTTSLEVGGGVQIWLFSLCGRLELSDYWTFLESLLSEVMFTNFKPRKSTFLLLSLIANAESTSRSLQIMILHCRFL